MAVRFDADGEDFFKFINLGSTSQWSMTCWAKISVDRNDYSTVWSIDADGASPPYYVLETDSDGTTMTIATQAAILKSRSLTVGKWYYFGVSVDGSNGTWVTRAIDDSSFTVESWTGTGQTIALQNLIISDSSVTHEWLNGAVEAVKFWAGAALSTDELQQEAFINRPRMRIDNLKAWWPMVGTGGDTVDLSGRGLDLSGGSGTTGETGPGITWGAVSAPVFAPVSIAATATPGALAASVTFPAPVVSTGSTVTPSTVAAVVTTPAPIVSAGAEPTPAVLAVVATVADPTILTGGNVTIAVDPVPVTVAIPTPTVGVAAVVPAPLVPLSVAIPAPTIIVPFDVTVAPDALGVVVTLLPPDVDTPTLPGSLITADGQLEYGDPSSPILLGTGTSYRLKTIRGWDSSGSIDNGNTERQRRHGARPGPKYGQQRIVTAVIMLDGIDDPAQAADLYAALELATPILEDAEEVPLVIRLYNGQTRLAYGALIDRDMANDQDYNAGAPLVGLQFACSDPLRYSPDARTAVILPNSTVHATNAGNTKARPEIRISGACTNPQVINVTTGRRLAFGVVLGSSDWITIDCNRGTARLNDETSVLAGLSAASVPSPEAYWLQPGSNQLTFTCTSPGAGARLDYVYRDSFL